MLGSARTDAGSSRQGRDRSGVWKAVGRRARLGLLVGPEGPFTAATFLANSRTIVAVTDAGHRERRTSARSAERFPSCSTLRTNGWARRARELTPEERELYSG